MKTASTFFIIIFFISITQSAFSQTTITVRANDNNVPITKVTYTVDDILWTQNASTRGGSFSTHNIVLKSVEVNDNGTARTLEFFNLGASVTNNNFTANTTGVGVYKDGNTTTTADPVQFDAAINDMSSDSSLLHMLVYDATANVPNGSEFDIIWNRGMLADDYIVLGERNGNSTFNVIALDINGNTIAGASDLQFRSPYDWNTGFAPGNQTRQPMHLTAVKVAKFNTSTPIHGFRIDNTGEADIRFFMMGDNTFDDNPTTTSLPIELVNFEVQTTERSNTLQWTTASELNGDFFEVQHSTDGVHFEGLDLVNAVGESSTIQYYDYIHSFVASGTHYYRLRLVDNDGTFEYSATKAVTIGDLSTGTVSIYPNPTTTTQIISIVLEQAADRTVQLINTIGVIVYETTLQDNVLQVNLNELTVGVYSVVITDNDSHISLTRRLIIGQ